MATKYKELLAKHFPHGTGRQALAAGWAKKKMDDALMALRQEMPMSRIVIKGLPKGIKDALGTGADSAFFSADNLAKQLNNHPDIAEAVYRDVFNIMRLNNEIYLDGPYSVRVLIKQGGKDYRLVLKTTNNRTNVYLSALYRQKARDVERVKRHKK